MPMLSYSQLVLQLLRYKDDLTQHGFTIDLKKDQNMYKDTLLIKGKHGFRDFYFSTQPYLWDNQKQFMIY